MESGSHPTIDECSASLYIVRNETLSVESRLLLAIEALAHMDNSEVRAESEIYINVSDYVLNMASCEEDREAIKMALQAKIRNETKKLLALNKRRIDVFVKLLECLGDEEDPK